MTGGTWVWAVIAWMAAVPGAAYWATSAERRRRREWARRRDEASEAARRLSQQQASLRQEHAALEQTMARLAGSYDLTKRLLITLDRREAALGLADALTAAFPQAAFRLVFTQPPDAGPSVQTALTLDRRGATDAAPDPGDAWLIDRFQHHPAIWSSLPSVGVTSTVEVEMPDTLRQAVAFPFVLGGALQGFLAVRRLAPEEVERCGILISQFALAVRRIRLYERVQELAIRDGLTGLFVRRHFVSRLQEEVARAARHDLPLAFLMVDIDHFKQINDTHGHLVGDAVLRELAAVLRAQVRDVDLLGRYGGEEFGVGLLETEAAEAQAAAERIRHAVEDAVFRAYDERLAVTVSIGIATFPAEAADAAELIERADAAMYQAKTAGRNRVIGAAR